MRADRLRGAVLLAMVLAVPLAYSFRFVSFLHAKEVTLNIGLCVLAWASLRSGGPSWAGLRAFGPLWLLVAGAALVHLSVLPARLPSAVLVEASRGIALLLVPALAWDPIGRPPWRDRIRAALVGSGACVAVLGILQYAGLASCLFPAFPGYTQRAYSVFGNQDLFGSYLAVTLSLVPTCAAMGRRAGQAAAVGALPMTAGLLISGSRAAWLAAGIGIALALAQGGWTCRRRVAMAAPVLLMAVVTVAVAPEATLGRAVSAFRGDDAGLHARRWFWNGTVRMVRDHPAFGVGPGNYAYWSPRYLGEALHAPGGETLYRSELRVEHAHSEPLQILAETGVMGLAPAAYMLVRLLQRRGPEWAGLAALLVCALAGAPFRSAPHALAGVLLAAMLLHRGDAPSDNRAMGQAGAVGLAAAATLLVLFHAWTVAVPSYYLRAAQDAHLAGRDPLPLYTRAVDHPWPDPLARTQYAIALAERGRHDDAERQLERALQGSDSGEVYLMLGSLAAARGDKEEARTWLEQCLYRWPDSDTARRLLRWARGEGEGLPGAAAPSSD